MPLTRRDFLKTSSLAAAWLALAACSPQLATADPATPVFTTTPPPSDRILHVLRRFTYGPTPEMLAKARRLGLEAYLEEQLHPETIPDDEVETLLKRFTTLNMTVAERVQLELRGKPVQELIAATVLRQWRSQRQIYEKLVEFWGNHFSIYIGKNLCRILKTDDDQQAIRPNALGRFGDLLRASAHSPAMLVYLDNAESRAGAPNENYARELLELHTLGVDGGYTQADVLETARIFTGWTVIGPRNKKKSPGEFLFNPNFHEPGTKTVLGQTFDENGEAEGNVLLDVLARHPNTARFISAKFTRHFGADSPDAALVSRLTDVFATSDGDTRALIRALVNTDEFYTTLKVKRPLEFFVSALRVTDAATAKRTQKLTDHLRMLGQTPFTWPTPDGFPDTAVHWMTTSGLLERWNFANALVSNQIDDVTVDLRSLAQDATSPADLVDVLSIRFLGEPLPANARDLLVDFASTGDLADNLAPVAGLILGSPFFQMR